MAVVAVFVSVPNHELWTPDEPREAQIGREMLIDGFSATPTLSGEPFVEKPPLFPWAVAASYTAFGVSAGAARVPAALFSVLATLFAFVLARRAAGPVAGLAAAVALLTIAKFATTCFTAVNDTALTAFVAGGHLCFLIARESPRRAGPLLAAGAFASLAFLTKGVIGRILVGGPPVLALAVMAEWRTLRSLVPRALLFCGVPVALAAAAWVLAMAADSGWDVVRESVINNTVARTLGAAGSEFGKYGHNKPPWYYLHAFPGSLLPWTLAIPALLLARSLGRGWRAGRTRFLAILVLCGIAILSVPSGKRTLYFMPLLPAAAAVFGVWLSRIGSRSGGRLDAPTVTVLLGLIALATAALGALLALLAGGLAPIPKLEGYLENSRLALAAGSGLLWLVAVGAFVLARRARGGPDWRVVRTALVGFVAVVILVGAAIRPLQDPTKEWRTGSERVASLLAASPRLFGVDLGETERAVLSYYSGRPLTNVAEVADLDAHADVRGVVLEVGKALERRHAELTERFEVVERVELRQGDFVEVYRRRPSAGD